jgi:hypothetical protein
VARRIKTQKLQVSAQRRGEIRFHTAYTAPEAARVAAKMARQGWTVEVQDWQSGRVKMKCRPGSKRDRAFAACEIKPAFKKQIRGR